MKEQNLNELGRSMVEMLGVLAIIGVLSIVGIAGYRKAMDKLHANDLINDTSRIAHQVAFERQMNPTNETMESLLSKHNPFTQYPVDFSTNTEQTFSLAMKNSLDKGLCIQIMKMNWSLPIAISLNNEQLTPPLSEDKCANSNTLSFTFANDLGSGEGVAGAGQCATGTQCGQNCCDEGLECNTVLSRCESPCPEGVSRSTRDGTCSVCVNGNVYLAYNSDPCNRAISGCTSNDECENGEFCNLRGSTRSYPNSGTCESIGTGATYTYNDIVYTKSPGYIQWWGAVNWCRAQGLEMISFAEMNPQSSWSTLRSVFGTSSYFFTTTSVDSSNVKGIRLNTSSYNSDNAGRTNGDYYALCR